MSLKEVLILLINNYGRKPLMDNPLALRESVSLYLVVLCAVEFISLPVLTWKTVNPITYLATIVNTCISLG